MYKNKKIAAVVPAFNEENFDNENPSNIPDLIDEIYCINDGSTDNTEELIKNCQESDKRIILINHPKNLDWAKH